MADREPSLTPHGVKLMLDGSEVPEGVTVQILQLKKIVEPSQGTTRYRVQVSDGSQTCGTCMLATQRNELVDTGLLDPLCVVRVQRFITNTVQDKQFIVLVELDILMLGAQVGHVIGDVQGAKSKQQPANTTATITSAKPSSASSVVNSASSNGTVSKPAPAAPPVQLSQPAKIIHPIISLSPYQNKWCIRVRVTQKNPIKTWSNKRGEGKLFSVDLADESGEIRATAFNTECDRFYHVLEPQNVYLIRGGAIKVANRQFTSVDNDYELTFTSETQIEPCFDESACNLPTVTFRRTKIKDIAQASHEHLIDVMGVISSVGSVENITARASMKQMKKRDVRIVDDSGCTITITFWGEEAEGFSADVNSLVLIKCCKIREFGGGLSLNSTSGSQVHVNPDVPEAHAIRGWFDSQESLDSMQNVSAFGAAGPGPEVRKPVPLAVVEANCVTAGEKGDYYSVKAEVLNVMKENSMYPACPSGDCNKKVIDQNTGMYRCEKCNKEYPNFAWRLLLIIRIGDFSSSCMTTIFQDVAEKMLGIGAAELASLREQDMQAYDEVFDRLLFRSFIFRIRAKQEMFNDEMKMKLVCVKVDEVNSREYMKYLRDNVRQLLALPSPF